MKGNIIYAIKTGTTALEDYKNPDVCPDFFDFCTVAKPFSKNRINYGKITVNNEKKKYRTWNIMCR